MAPAFTILVREVLRSLCRTRIAMEAMDRTTATGTITTAGRTITTTDRTMATTDRTTATATIATEIDIN